MRIDDVFDRSVFSNCAMKLVLNISTIKGIIDNFSAKSFSDWEVRACEYCTPEKKCKKHSSLDRILSTSRAVKVEGMGENHLYLSKSDMYLFNPKNNSMLIIDCPPFFSNEYPINDVWVRKINPFSVVSQEAANCPVELVQTIDLNDILKYRRFSCYFGKVDNYDKYLVVQKIYDQYHWKLEDK